MIVRGYFKIGDQFVKHECNNSKKQHNENKIKPYTTKYRHWFNKFSLSLSYYMSLSLSYLYMLHTHTHSSDHRFIMAIQFVWELIKHHLLLVHVPHGTHALMAHSMEKFFWCRAGTTTKTRLDG